MNPRVTHDQDEWLMVQVAQDRPEMLEPLIRRYGTLLLSFIQQMIGDRQRSEDVFQDVFLAVWNKRRSYRFPRPFKPWLYAIASNRVRQLLRTRAYWLMRDEESLDPPSNAPAPVDSAIATESATLVKQAVALLPPRQRMVVTMRMWSGLSYVEIAEVLQVGEVTVRSTMHDALARIRRYLEPRM